MSINNCSRYIQLGPLEPLQSFGPKYTTDVDFFTLDFGLHLYPNETITSATGTCSYVSGQTFDATAESMITGTATIHGTQVQQELEAGEGGNTYSLNLTIVTSESRTLTGCGLVEVLAIP